MTKLRDQDQIPTPKAIMTESDKPAITKSMWLAAIIIAMQSFSFGYVFSCLNACLVTGDNNSGSDCFHDTDSSCPAGTMYNDINLTLSKHRCFLI